MRSHRVARPLILATSLLVLNVLNTGVALAASASELNHAASKALRELYAGTPGAQTLGEKAVAILIFPSIKKGGFIIGGQFGDGVLLKGGRAIGYYRSIAASYGLQAGGQAFSYVLFFMDEASLDYVDKSDGWELGVGPSFVVLDEGFGKSMTTTTMKSGVYAYIFGQKGAMAGLGLQGSKITKIHPNP